MRDEVYRQDIGRTRTGPHCLGMESPEFVQIFRVTGKHNGTVEGAVEQRLTLGHAPRHARKKVGRLRG